MIQDIIEEELKKEINIKFNECIHEYHPECSLAYTQEGEIRDEYCTLCDAQDKIEKFILEFCTSQQHKLLQSIVEEIEGMERKAQPETASQSACDKCGFRNDKINMCQCNYNQALSDLKAKLLEGNSK